MLSSSARAVMEEKQGEEHQIVYSKPLLLHRPKVYPTLPGLILSPQAPAVTIQSLAAPVSHSWYGWHCASSANSRKGTAWNTELFDLWSHSLAHHGCPSPGWLRCSLWQNLHLSVTVLRKVSFEAVVSFLLLTFFVSHVFIQQMMNENYTQL